MSINARFIVAVKTYIKGIVQALTMLLITSACLYSQDLSRRITIVADNAPLEDVIREIEEKGGVYFSYSPQTIPVSLPVSINAQDKSIKYILKKVFRKNGIKYDLVENHIVLRKPGFDPELDYQADLNSGKLYTISGYLKDKESGEVLIGAHVYEKESYEGTATNAYGFYSLTLPAGVHQMVFSFIH